MMFKRSIDVMKRVIIYVTIIHCGDLNLPIPITSYNKGNTISLIIAQVIPGKVLNLPTKQSYNQGLLYPQSISISAD